MKRTVITGLLTLALVSSACSRMEPPRDPLLPGAPEARPGGLLRVGITNPGPISPFEASTSSAKLISRAMCDTLVVLDPATGQVREGIAEGWVEADKGTFITIRPAHGTVLNNGRALSSKDISQTVLELRSRLNSSPYRPLGQMVTNGLSKRSAQEGGTDADALNPLLVDVGEQATTVIQPLNEIDVQWGTDPASPVAVRLMTEQAFAPIGGAEFAANPEAFRASPVCVGPYALTRPYKPGDRNIELRRSSHYVANSLGYTNGGKGYADTISFQIYPDRKAVMEAYAKGDVDVAELGVESLRDDKLRPEDLRKGVPTTVEYWGFSLPSEGPWTNPVVRRALSMALDRRPLAQLAGVAATPTLSFLPPSLEVAPGRNGRVDGGAMQLPTLAGHREEGDVEAAKKLLDDAGISLSGTTLPLTFNGEKNPLTRRVMVEIGRQLQEAFGLTATLAPEFWVPYRDVVPTGSYYQGTYRMSWSSTVTEPTPMFNDPTYFLQTLVGSKAPSGSNWSGWKSPAFTNVTDVKLPQAEKPSQRAALLADASAILANEMPLTPLFATSPVWLVREAKLGAARPELVGRDGVLSLREIFVKN